MVMGLPSLHSAWDGEVPLAAPWRAWYVTTFLGPEEGGRVLRGVREVEAFFCDVNRLHYDATGEARPLPRGFISELQRRVLTAMYPSACEIALGATRHPADQVARGLRQLGATEARWRERYL